VRDAAERELDRVDRRVDDRVAHFELATAAVLHEQSALHCTRARTASSTSPPPPPAASSLTPYETGISISTFDWSFCVKCAHSFRVLHHLPPALQPSRRLFVPTYDRMVRPPERGLIKAVTNGHSFKCMK
jgi:hypothetical protein